MRKTVRKPRKDSAPRVLVECSGGPFSGYRLALSSDSACTTGYFVVRGEIGRYRMGKWEARNV